MSNPKNLIESAARTIIATLLVILLATSLTLGVVNLLRLGSGEEIFPRAGMVFVAFLAAVLAISRLWRMAGPYVADHVEVDVDALAHELETRLDPRARALRHS